MNLVYVDDDADDHLFLNEAIRPLGFNCNLTSLFNGAQLIDFLFKTGTYKNSTGPAPDLILLDMNMPVMNGITCLRTIRSIREFRHLPVFILSTCKDENSKNDCIKLGADGFYTKPILINDLEKLIQIILEKAEDSAHVDRR